MKKPTSTNQIQRIQSIMYNHLGYVSQFEKPTLEPNHSLQTLKNEMIQKYAGVTMDMIQEYGDRRVEEHESIRKHEEKEDWETHMNTEQMTIYKNPKGTKFKIESKPTLKIIDIKIEGRELYPAYSVVDETDYENMTGFKTGSSVLCPKGNNEHHDFYPVHIQQDGGVVHKCLRTGCKAHQVTRCRGSDKTFYTRMGDPVDCTNDCREGKDCISCDVLEEN